MEEYLKIFNTSSEYQTFVSGDYATPNVSYVLETNSVYYHPYDGNEPIEPDVPDVPDTPDTPSSTANLCDIAYWDGSKVKTVSQDNWNSSLGTPVGVVVIPSGMLPDGKARMIGLKYATAAGTSSDSSLGMFWGGYGTDTSLTNYTKVPTTDNAGSTSTGSNANGYLPSDKFTGRTSFVDSTAKYSQTSNLIPSPYLGDDKTFNPEYSKEILSGDTNVNVLSDFNGLSNTEYLVGLGNGYTAANAAHNYDGGVTGTDIQWYLPAMGELGFIMPRFNAINAAIQSVGGVAVYGDGGVWSSSEYSSNNVYTVTTGQGGVANYGKTFSISVRAFACL